MVPQNDAAASLGANIRRRRQALGLSLDALARESNVSSTMLSEVERSVKNPTVKLAYQIARALGCTLTDLLEDEVVAPVQVTRAGRRQTTIDPITGTTRHSVASPLAGGTLDMTWFELPPFSTTVDQSPARSGGFQQVIAVRGRIGVVVDGQPHELLAGDSMVATGSTRLTFRNLGDGLAEFFVQSERLPIRR
jgi:transcriptional regulator with XRE-family HTH domain